MSIFQSMKTGCAKHGRAASWSFGRGIYIWDLEAYDSYDNPKHATVGQFLESMTFLWNLFILSVSVLDVFFKTQLMFAVGLFCVCAALARH